MNTKFVALDAEVQNKISYSMLMLSVKVDLKKWYVFIEAVL